MQRTTVILFALACVMGGALLYGLTADSPAPPEPILTAVPDAELSRRMDRLEVRLERITQVLEGLPRASAAGAASELSSEATGPAAPRSAPGPSLDTKGRAPSPAVMKSSAIVPQSFAGRSFESVAMEARSLLQGRKKDAAGAVERWRALLARKLPAEERYDALIGLGIAQREYGESGKAAARFRQVIDEAPSGSVTSHSARLQLGATLFRQKNYRAALEEAQRVQRDGSSLELQVINARWMGATCLIQLGDKAGARAELESMLEDYKDKQGMEPLLRQYRAQLAKLQ